MIRPLTPEVRAVALSLYSWSLMALLIVMLAAKPYSASRETRGTATMLIRKTLMGRERTGRLTAIAPHTRDKERGTEGGACPSAREVRQPDSRPTSPPGGRRTPRRDQTMTID